MAQAVRLAQSGACPSADVYRPAVAPNNGRAHHSTIAVYGNQSVHLVGQSYGANSTRRHLRLLQQAA
jgi:hypothetical protein